MSDKSSVGSPQSRVFGLEPIIYHCLSQPVCADETDRRLRPVCRTPADRPASLRENAVALVLAYCLLSITASRPLREAQAFSPAGALRRGVKNRPSQRPKVLFCRSLRPCVSARECCCSCSCLLSFIHHRFPTSARSTSLFSCRGLSASEG